MPYTGSDFLKNLSIAIPKGNNENTKELLNRLGNEFSAEIFVNLNNIICNLSLSDNFTLSDLSSILSEMILINYENKLIDKIIYTNYYYLKNSEKKDILKHTSKYLSSSNNNYFSKRKDLIKEKINNYLIGNDHITLEGFVNFRLQEYISELEEIVERATDDFFVEKEYEEFIKLLKYFVSIQPCKEEVIHLIINAPKNYTIFNGKKEDITEYCRERFLSNISGDIINYDDLLVSSLITMSPKKIYIHNEKNTNNEELMNTIKNVFHKKTYICTGCTLCERD